MPGGAVLIVGAAIAGAVVIDYGVRAIKPAFATTPAAAGASSSSVSLQPTTGPAGAERMLAAATAVSALHIGYSQSVQTTGLLAGFRADCSGFVSYLVSQAVPSFGDQTTVTIPTDPNVSSGQGQYVTLWDRPQAGDAGHVIIEILGRWFESGGQATGGPSEITSSQAAAEIQNGMSAYHPNGL